MFAHNLTGTGSGFKNHVDKAYTASSPNVSCRIGNLNSSCPTSGPPAHAWVGPPAAHFPLPALRDDTDQEPTADAADQHGERLDHHPSEGPAAVEPFLHGRCSEHQI